MNDYDIRKELRARISTSPLVLPSELSGYKKCQKCKSEFEYLYIGGVGDWRTTITCEVCFHVRRGVPYQRVIVPLVALQYNLTLEEAQRRLNIAHEQYLSDLSSSTDHE